MSDDFAARAADDWTIISTTVRAADGQPDWPQGFGGATVHALPDETPVWTVGRRTYIVDDDGPGLTVAEVPVRHLPRTGGDAKLRSFRLVRFSAAGLSQLIALRLALARAGPERDAGSFGVGNS